jgi:polysaccharide transporter, PST family
LQREHRAMTAAPDGGREARAARELGIAHLLPDLVSRSLRGGALLFGAQGLKVLLQFAAIVVLARLLPPAAFGLIAMVAAISLVLDLVKELGLSAATIQRPDITDAQVSALFWINTAAGAAMAAGLALAAPSLAAFYGQPELTAITRWLALGFLMSGLTVQHWALLRRQMRFGTVATLETGGEALALVAAIVLGVLGAGYWALVAQRLIGPAIALLGSWAVCRWRPAWPAPAPGVTALVRYGMSLTGCNIAAALARSLDQVLIGWLWGPSMLGLYERAAKLLMVPVNNINAPLYAVALPALSRLADDPPRYRRAYLAMLEKVAMLTMPAGALVAVAADWVVGLLYGPNWSAAAPLVACFGIIAAYQPVAMAAALIYLTHDRPAELLRNTLLDASIGIAAALAALPLGAIGVAAALAVSGVFVRMPLAFWLACRGAPVRQAEIYRAILPSLLAAATAAATVALLRLAVLPADWPAVRLAAIVLPVAIGIALAVFALLPPSRRALGLLIRLPRLVGRKPA